MAQLRESSGLHSLAALRQHEAERSQKQAEEARAQAEAEQRARLVAERERAREAEQRAEVERSLLRSADAAQRTELAELERARTVELDRAERDARVRRDLELSLTAAKSAQRHAEISLVARTARGRLINVLSVALCLASWLGIAAFYFAVVRPDADRSRVDEERALAAEHRERSDAVAIRARASQREAVLGDRVSSLEQALRDRSPAAGSAPTGGPGKRWRGPAPVPTPTSHLPCRDDGDPLNPCLKR
jgi:membrane protein involved in colicin uptake